MHWQSKIILHYHPITLSYLHDFWNSRGEGHACLFLWQHMIEWQYKKVLYYQCIQIKPQIYCRPKTCLRKLTSFKIKFHFIQLKNFIIHPQIAFSFDTVWTKWNSNFQRRPNHKGCHWNFDRIGLTHPVKELNCLDPDPCVAG